ncbi:hypothetical protein [Thalassobellus citreus]|uniref:hypothetical protein n=1 Tax=Thalassobellus citreus TaxID=3367752 RepID=UPI00378D0B3D
MIKKISLLFIFLITLETVSPWSTIPLGNTFLFWIVNGFTIILFLKAKTKYYDQENDKNILILKLYLLWNIVSIIRGAFVAENYWEVKNLVTMGFTLLLPLTIYISSSRNLLQIVFNNYMTYILPLFFVFALIIDRIAYGVYLIPVSFVLLFLPLLSKKWKIIMLCFTFIGITASFAARSNVIKFIVPLILGILYYFRPFVNKNILGVARILLVGLPVVLFVLGLTGQFNVFKISDYVEGDYTTATKTGEQEDLTADTRTGLYVEVIASALVNDYVWFGRTPARGNDSLLFGALIESQTGTGKYERYVNEVSVLNVFTWTGLIGLILYFLVFLRASYLALYKSKSWYMKILAVYICFRWTYAWVEDFSRFDLSYIFLWFIIGMCYSVSFRSMTDDEFKYWIRGVFDIRYRKATLKKVRVIKQS